MKKIFSYLFIIFMILSSFLFRLFPQPKSVVVHPDWSYDKTIYEVNLRQYTQSGSFNEFKEHLPRLKELGIGILWFMPLHPIGELNRKGTLGSYYSVKDYYGIDSSYGTKEDFKNLVNEIHKQGMYIIIDWVANHTSWDNELTQTNPEFYKKDSSGNFVPPVPDWQDVIAFDYSNKNLWEYMSDAMAYWIKEFNIDGFRCDVAGMIPTEFWNYNRKKLNQIKPVFMLAEWESPDLHIQAFDMTYSWDIYHIMNDIYKSNKNVYDIFKQLAKEKKQYPENAFRMRFLTNHDENSWNGTEFERMGDGVEAFAVVSSTIPGMFLIYTGQEIGLNKRLDFFEKDPIEWKESKFSDFYKKLISLKKNNSALWNGEKGGELIRIKNSNDSSVISFIRKKESNKIFVLANLTKNPIDIKINDKELIGSYINFFSGEETSLNQNEKFSLAPFEYKIFVKK